VQQVRANPQAAAFLKPVNIKEAPDYYQVITKPIDLSAIRDKNRAFKYKSRAEFLADIKLMVDNCYTYNSETRNPHLLLLADNIHRQVTQLIEVMDKEIIEAEQEFLAAEKERSRMEEEREMSESFFDKMESGDNSNGLPPNEDSNPFSPSPFTPSDTVNPMDTSSFIL